MKKITTIFFSLITVSNLMTANTLPRTSDPIMKEKADKQILVQNKAVLIAAVEAYNKNAPQKVDNYTTFVEAEAKDLTLIQIFEINTGSKSDKAVQNEDQSRMGEAIKYGVCTTAKRFLDSNINLSYVYKSQKTKVELFRFDYSSKDCSNIWAGLE